jgi:hypothetical protein
VDIFGFRFDYKEMVAGVRGLLRIRNVGISAKSVRITGMAKANNVLFRIRVINMRAIFFLDTV